MTTRSARVFIHEMLDEIRTIDDLVGGLDIDIFAGATFKGQRRGVERCIEIISEASKHLPEDLKSRHPEIPWRSVRDVGNVFRHGYWSVDPDITWGIVTNSLPALRMALEKMLVTLPPDTSD